jgi:hypothetical protein
LVDLEWGAVPLEAADLLAGRFDLGLLMFLCVLLGKIELKMDCNLLDAFRQSKVA